VLIARAEIEGRGPFDVRIEGGRVMTVAAELPRSTGEAVLDAAGGALLPGLHDHHLHLLALAAAESSVRCGPPDVRGLDELAAALRGEGWLRGVGYHESVAGELDRGALDALAPGRPLRIQHRSGALWVLSSAAVEHLGLDAGADHPGVERDADGRATGRVYRADAWLRQRLGAAAPPSLAPIGRRLARFGVTGLTDATAGNGPEELMILVAAAASGELPQRLLVMGTPELPEPGHPRVARGAVKILLAEPQLPRIEELEARIADAHARGRPVAIHCVTCAELVLAAVAFGAAGCRPGDRIEHASLAPPDLVKQVADLPLAVVTQPGFVRERGDAYRAEVEPDDLPWLYRCRGFLEARVPLAAGTDAPFGDPDPWLAMRAAVERRTDGGAALGHDEALSPEEALALFTSPPEAPGDPPRRVRPGAPADLCLLDRPWAAARRGLSSDAVRATLRDGEILHRGD
jgi:predicted amidohydrolase YtcJ